MFIPMDKELKVATLVCPGVFLPDIVNAHTAFSLSPNAKTYLVWKDLEPFAAYNGWPMAATTTFEQCPEVDVLLVGMMAPDSAADPEVLAFIERQAKQAKAVIGICYGVLVLGSAGLLTGKKATSNFSVGEDLREFGAEPVLTSEVVVDGNLYTAGPAHGCFEAAIEVLTALRGPETGKMLELMMEYNPHPKFKVGSPLIAGEELAQKFFSEGAGRTHVYMEAARRGYKIMNAD